MELCFNESELAAMAECRARLMAHLDKVSSMRGRLDEMQKQLDCIPVTIADFEASDEIFNVEAVVKNEGLRCQAPLIARRIETVEKQLAEELANCGNKLRVTRPQIDEWLKSLVEFRQAAAIESLAAVCDDAQAARKLVGEGSYFQRIRALAESLQLAERLPNAEPWVKRLIALLDDFIAGRDPFATTQP